MPLPTHRSARIAYVLFLDIVGYSWETTSAQARLIERLNAFVNAAPAFASATLVEAVQTLPTGDGMALVFYNDVLAPVQTAVQIARAVHGGTMPLRMGMHSGLVFFAGIRECYNRRASDPAFQNLTFCLLGVATPSDLIQDTRISPFNIGRRIELRDFTPEEAEPLAMGLLPSASEGTGDRYAHLNPRALRLLKRILHWTNGHPYMTQRLCRAVAATLAEETRQQEEEDDDELEDMAVVDAECERLFFTKSARKSDDNLAFVRNRLLFSEADKVAVLELYRKVRGGGRLRDDETNPLCGILRLSGIVAVEWSRLQVRNRVYQQIFDKTWIDAHMPDAELRRQKQAFRRGLALAGTLAGGVLSVVTLLAVWAIHNAHLADNNARLANKNASVAAANELRANSDEQNAKRGVQKALAIAKEKEAALKKALAEKAAVAQAQKARKAEENANQQRQIAERSAADSKKAKNIAVQSVEKADRNLYVANMSLISTAYNLNDFIRMSELLAQTQKRGHGIFEWEYWNHLCHIDLLTLKGHSDWVTSVAFSPDGKRVLIGSSNADSPGEPGGPNGNGTVTVWNAANGARLLTLNTYMITSVAYSADGNRILAGSKDRVAKVWDAGGRSLLTLRGHDDFVLAVAFSPDGKRMLTGSQDGTAKVWDMQSGQEFLAKGGAIVTSVVCSPNGKRLLTGSCGSGENGNAAGPIGDGTAKVWDTASGRELFTLKGHKGVVRSVAFSLDGKWLLTGSNDGTAKLWDADGKELRTFEGHSDFVLAVAFSPDGKKVLTGSNDRTAKMWDTVSGKELLSVKVHAFGVRAVTFSPNGKRILTVGYNGILQVWDAVSGQELLTLKRHNTWITSAAFSLDGKRLLTGSYDKITTVWDAASGKELFSLHGHALAVTSVAFSPNGKRLLTGSVDATTKVWDAVRGQELLTLHGYPSGVRSVAFFSDGQRVLTSSFDGTVKVFDTVSTR